MVMNIPSIPDQGQNTPPQMPPENPQDSKKKMISAAVNTLWVFLGVQFATSIIIGLILGLFSGAEYAMGYGVAGGIARYAETISLFAATLAAGLAAVAYGANHLHVQTKDELKKTKFKPSWIFKGVCMAYTMSFAMSLIVTLINVIGEMFGFSIPSTVIPDNGSLLIRLINIITVALLAPFFEELIFRGVLCNALSRYNKGFAVVFTALIFALAHLNLDQGIPVFGMGLVFGFVYLRSKSLWATIAMHVINNLIALIVQYNADSFVASILLSGLVVVLAICGIYFIVKERQEVGSMFRLSGQAKEEWSLTAHSVSFWLLIALFVICSIGVVLAVSMANFLFY